MEYALNCKYLKKKNQICTSAIERENENKKEMQPSHTISIKINEYSFNSLMIVVHKCNRLLKTSSSSAIKRMALASDDPELQIVQDRDNNNNNNHNCQSPLFGIKCNSRTRTHCSFFV